MLGNPQSRILTPFFLPFLLFGPGDWSAYRDRCSHRHRVRGAYYLGGCLDFRRWARSPVRGRLQAVRGTTCISRAATRCSWHPRTSHGSSALFYRRGEVRRLTPAVFAGLLMALIFMEGGIYAVPQTALILTILTLMICVQKRTVFPPLVLAATGVFAVAFSAPKLLPTLHLLSISARAVDAFEVNSIQMFCQELFSRHQEFPRSLAGGFWGFHEYAASIGGHHRVSRSLRCRNKFLAPLPMVGVIAHRAFIRGRKSGPLRTVDPAPSRAAF